MIAANIMTTEAVLPERASLLDAAALVGGQGAAVVVADDGRVLGLVTPALIAGRHSGGLSAVPVAEAMDRDFAAVAPEAGYEEVSLALDRSSSTAVVVVDDGGRHLGLITPEDMHRRLWEYEEKKKAPGA